VKNVQFIGGRWRARLTVPAELREIVGKRELVELLTDEPRLRERQALKALNQFHAILEDARDRLERNRPTLSKAAKYHFRRELELDDVDRSNRLHERSQLESEGRSIYATDLRRLTAGHASREEAEALIGWAADDLTQRGLAPDVPRTELLRALAEVQLEAFEHAAARDRHELGPIVPRSKLLSAPDDEHAEDRQEAEGGPLLSDILLKLHKERTASRLSMKPKTMEEHRNAIRMFEEFMGRSVPVREVGKKDIVAYKQALLETPLYYTRRFPGLTLPQARRANRQRAEPLPCLAPQTINMKWLSHLTTVLQWAVDNDYAKSNPAKGVRVMTPSASQKEPSRKPFSAQELELIFGHDLFKNPAEYGLKQWATLVMLYTGVRGSSEMAQLPLDAVHELQGVMVFDLDGKLKNTRSKRLVPLHRDLVRIGFLKYVEYQKRSGSDRLFPDWEPVDRVNDWFNVTFLRKTLGITDKSKVFYSFRHTLMTALTREGCPRELVEMITGHRPQGISSVYIQESPVELMQKQLNRASFRIPILR